MKGIPMKGWKEGIRLKTPSIAAICLLAVLAAAPTAPAEGENAASAVPGEWVPGTPHPRAPHVVADNEPGHWKPAPGWVFTDLGGLAVMPMSEALSAEATPSELPVGRSGTCTLPAPEGFRDPVPRENSLLRAFRSEEAAIGRIGRLRGHWAALDATGERFITASVAQPWALANRMVSSFEFPAVKKTALDEMRAEFGNGEAGIRLLGPYRDGSDRLCVTLVTQVSDGPLPACGVRNSAFFHFHSRVLCLWIETTALGEEATDAAIAETRELLDRWLDALAAAAAVVEPIEESSAEDTASARTAAIILSVALALAVLVVCIVSFRRRNTVRRGTPKTPGPAGYEPVEVSSPAHDEVPMPDAAAPPPAPSSSPNSPTTTSH